MALVLADRVQETGTANTTVSFTLSGSVTGFQSFAVIGNTNTTYYSATDVSGNWETGLGTYSTTGPTLTRTTILSSSNSGSAVTFSGTVNVFVTYPSGSAVWSSNNPGTAGNVLLSNGTGVAPSWAAPSVPSGSVILFYQAAAPTGWTQVTTENNKALRVVSGTGAGTGGSVAFTTAFASQAVSGSVGTSGATTLSTSEIPSHTHPSPYSVTTGGCFVAYGFDTISVGPSGIGSTPNPTGSTGGGGSHTHGGGTFTGTAINLAVQYIDIILCSKN
jgi:hypothetical protein